MSDSTTAAPVAGLNPPPFVREIGGMAHLAALTIGRGARRPFSWAPEFANQFRFTIRICFFPLILTAFALSFGPVGVQASDFFGLFGALDRLGTVYEITVIRLFAPMIVGIVLAGAAGTAICADLGARVVREEVDALSVLGIDPVKNLVVPRALVLALSALLLDAFAVVAGLLGMVVVALRNGQSLKPIFATFFSNATPLELEASVGVAGAYGVIVAIVCCYKGLNVSRGPESVGRAVNQAVVICFLAIGFTGYVLQQLLLATHPILSQVRG